MGGERERTSNRPLRERRPSVRAMNGVPVLVTNGMSKGKGKERATSPPPPAQPPIRLTIRIPARASLTLAKARGDGPLGFSAGAARAVASTSRSTSASGTVFTEQHRPSFSPTSTTHSPSVSFARLERESVADRWMDEDQQEEEEEEEEEEGEEKEEVEEEEHEEEQVDADAEEEEEEEGSEAPGRGYEMEVDDGGGASSSTHSRSRSQSSSASYYRPHLYGQDPAATHHVKQENGDFNGMHSASTSTHRSDVNGGAATGAPVETKPTAKIKIKISKTFNQSWSISEQHLLEKLLDDYPDGVKNR